MSSTASNTVTPPWVPILEQELKDNPKRVSYSFATLSPENKPKVRYVIHRGITPSNLLLTTTDTRMSKPIHLNHSPTVEIAWWIEETNVQFRITGKAYTIPPSSSSSSSSASDTNKEEFQKIIKGLDIEDKEEGKEEWWIKKNDDLWKGVSGHLRAGFGRPTPGKPLEEVSDPKSWPETIPAESDDAEESKKIAYAREHFAIIAIRPEAVEYLELKPIPNRRTQWTLDDNSQWNERKVAP